MSNEDGLRNGSGIIARSSHVSWMPVIAGEYPTREELESAQELGMVVNVDFTPELPVHLSSLQRDPGQMSIDFYAENDRRIPEPIPGYVVIHTADGRIVQYRREENGDISLIAIPGTYTHGDIDSIAQAVGEHMRPNATLRQFVESTGMGSVPEPEELEDESSAEPDVQTEWVLDDGSTSPYGPVERQLREDVGSLKLGGHLSKTLVQAAYALARELDRGAKMATAAVAKQLHEYVKELERLAGSDDDTRSHNADLSTPV